MHAAVALGVLGQTAVWQYAGDLASRPSLIGQEEELLTLILSAAAEPLVRRLMFATRGERLSFAGVASILAANENCGICDVLKNCFGAFRFRLRDLPRLLAGQLPPRRAPRTRLPGHA